MKMYPLMWLCAGALLVGCAGRPVDSIPGESGDDGSLVSGLDGGDSGLEGADTYATDQNVLDGQGMLGDLGRTIGSDTFFDREAIYDQDSPLAQRIFYFAYDRDTLSDQYLDSITDHGRYLATYPDAAVRLEGHADERGTREYNIALAERRAQAVKRLMMLQGASYNQVITISYGEEQPAVLGHTDDAYQRNRRVELVYE